MTTIGKLYTIGYAGLQSIEQLQSFLAQKVFLVDIRYYPSSNKVFLGLHPCCNRDTIYACYVRVLIGKDAIEEWWLILFNRNYTIFSLFTFQKKILLVL